MLTMNSKTSKYPFSKTCKVFLDVKLAVSQWDFLSSVLFHPGPAHLAHFSECRLLQRKTVNFFHLTTSVSSSGSLQLCS